MTRQPFQHDALSGYATCPAPGTIRLERRYPATPAELWSWLTDPAKRRLWWAAGRIELHRGGAVELGWRFRELSPSEPVPAEFDLGTGGLFLFGRVTRIEPVHLLGFTWGEDSEVVIGLEEREGGTALVLTHRRLEERGDMIRIASGWHTHLLLLEDVLAGRERRPFWHHFGLARVEHEQRLGEPPVVIRVSRIFRASADDVFDAWTSPGHIPLWMFASEAGDLVRAENDVRPGGSFVFTSREDTGDIDHAGTWNEVSRPHRLVYTYCLPGFAPLDVDRVTLEIRRRRSGGCEAVLTHEMKPVWAEYSARAEAGWLDLLEEVADLVED